MIWGPAPVKHSNTNSQNPGQRRQVAPVWLRGWTLAIPSVGIALVAAVLAIPRATKPETAPQPVIHRSALDASLRQLARYSAAARAEPLPFVVREVGEAYRRLGRTQYEGAQLLDDAQAEGWQRLIRGVASKVGNEPLLTLRAVQADMFVTSLEAWESTGKISDDLVELGGDFVRLARLNHWWAAAHLNMSSDERWAVALLRWTALAGLTQREPYQLDRELEVVELRFFYDHPALDGTQLRARQKILERYAKLDSDYPLDYSRGVLFAEAGQYDFAAASFMRHLEAHHQGPYAIRARNHLIWSTEQVRNLENDGPAR